MNNRRSVIATARRLGIPASTLIYIDEGIWVASVVITPGMAVSWMEFNIGNRSKKSNNIRAMADDVKTENFPVTHEGIGFTSVGELIDGQNTLSAIIEADKPLKRLVYIGLKKEVQKVINQGVSRTAVDAAFFSGVDGTRQKIAACRLCEIGISPHHRSLSNSRMLAVLAKHDDAYKFVQDNLQPEQKGIARPQVVAAIMRAYYHCENDRAAIARLKKFCSILNDGQFGNIEADKSAFKLREILPTARRNGGSVNSRQIYLLSESAISSFLSRSPVRSLRLPRTETFPLPHETVTEGTTI